MSEHRDVQVVTVSDPDTGEEFEAVVVPKGTYLCLITPETAAKYADWTEVKAVRIKVDGDTIAGLELSDDLEWLTDPEADDAA